jgi:hypothetical protein
MKVLPYLKTFPDSANLHFFIEYCESCEPLIAAVELQFDSDSMQYRVEVSIVCQKR